MEEAQFKGLYRPNPIETLKAARYYRCQCNDGDNWRGNEAEAFINTLVDTEMEQLPRYKKAELSPSRT